jgi:hypothetical protein
MDRKIAQSGHPPVIRTPDQRLRVFVSTTLYELVEGSQAVKEAVEGLNLLPVLFELDAQPNPAHELMLSERFQQSHPSRKSKRDGAGDALLRGRSLPILPARFIGSCKKVMEVYSPFARDDVQLVAPTGPVAE